MHRLTKQIVKISKSSATSGQFTDFCEILLEAEANKIYGHVLINAKKVIKLIVKELRKG